VIACKPCTSSPSLPTYGPAKCLRSFGVTWTWKHPKDVSGLVLLDPGPEFLQNTLTPAQWAKSSNGQMAT
jgi:hypothetical protein